MAKKNEFKPDKPRNGLASRLHLTQQQRRRLLHWTLYGIVLLALSILQDVILCHLRIFGAATELVPCAIFLICILEGVDTGSIFALAASLAYLFSGTAPGPYAMVFIVVLAILATIFRQALLQKGFGAAMLCAGGAMVLYELAVFAIGLFLGLTHGGRIFGFLLTAGMSMLAAPVLYPVFLSIGTIGGEPWKE